MGSRRTRGPNIVNNTVVMTTGASYTMENEAQLFVRKTAGSATSVTLPANPVPGMTVLVADDKGDAASNNITIQGAGGSTIDGQASVVINLAYGSMTFIWTGGSGGTPQWNVQSAKTSSGSGAIVATSFAWANIANVNAAGTVLANAAALAAAVTLVAGANNTAGVALPSAAAGQEYWVYSSVATNTLKVYPPVNGTINNAAANSAFVASAQTLYGFICTGNGNFIAT